MNHQTSSSLHVLAHGSQRAADVRRVTMLSPVVAMLWEQWRMTRGEIAWRLVLSIAAASAVLMLATLTSSEIVRNMAAVLALVLLVVPQMLGWFSIAMLNRGQSGFPLYLLYTRPLRTAVIVGVPMAYLATMSAALYVVSALLLRMVFGHPFPLLSIAAFIAILNVAQLAANWFTRRFSLRMLANVAVAMVWSGLSIKRLTVEEIPGPDVAPPATWPTVFDLAAADYVWIGAIGLALFGLTVRAVNRQRHGGGSTGSAAGPAVGFPDRLVSLFHFKCPTMSATRAQLWFDLRSTGLPLLTVGIPLALVNALLGVVSGPIDAVITADYREYVGCTIQECYWARPMSMLFAMVSIGAVTLLGSNAFGVRARQGRLHASAFEATQPYGTGRIAVLKLTVRLMCVLTALAAIVFSVWASGLFVGSGKIFGGPFETVAFVFGAFNGSQKLALTVAAFIGAGSAIALLASFAALRTRYSRRLNLAGLLLLCYLAGLVLLVIGGERWAATLEAILRTTSWAMTSAVVGVTAYLAWRAFAERLLTPGQACGAALLTAAFATAWVTLLGGLALAFNTEPPAFDIRLLAPALLPLTIGVLAPWSYSRIRHT